MKSGIFASHLHVVTADCLVILNRFLRRLRGDVGPGRHHQLACSQQEVRTLLALPYSQSETDCSKSEPTCLDTWAFWLDISGTLLGIRCCWGSTVARLCKRNLHIYLMSKAVMCKNYTRSCIITSDIPTSSPSRKVPILEFLGLRMEDLDPSSLSEQQEALFSQMKHRPILENQPSLLQMGPSSPVLAVASLQRLGQTLYL